MVDAMSSYAGIEIDLVDTPVDYLISSSNKCIQGMAGIGIVIVQKNELQRISEIKSRSYYLDLYKNFPPKVRRNSLVLRHQFKFFTPLKKPLMNSLTKCGIQERAKRYSLLYEQMHSGMVKLGFKPMLDSKE